MEQYIAEITQVVRDADQAFETVGGSSRHWVRECFLPLLEQAGFTIVPIAKQVNPQP